MRLSKSPYTQVKIIKDFTKSMCNYLRNKSNQQFKQEYAIINDVAHNYAMLTYYIDKLNQVSQLKANGFETIEMYDTLGNKLDSDSDDKDSAWIYYVARKIV
jgi:Tol biopolymer transport system component